MKVKDILQQKGRAVVTIEPDRTVHDAIHKLCEHRIGALVVKGERGDICGIITERDILLQCGERCSVLRGSLRPGETVCPAVVEEVMTRELIIGVLDDKIDYVMGVMTKNRIRHLPILDGGELVGIVSIGDVVNAHLNETEFENRLLKDYIHGLTH